MTLVELVLELDPMKTQGVEEALEYVHAHKHTERDRGPDEITDPYLKNYEKGNILTLKNTPAVEWLSSPGIRVFSKNTEAN